jgi:rubredoxin
MHMQKFFIGKHYSILCMGTDIDCFECLVCGYIYDPEAGDPVGGIPSGVNFLSLPDDWLCPECSAMKDEFALVEP